MITKAVKDGDEWVVTGTKNWISNLGIADFYIVFAKTDPTAARSRGISAFVVEADRPGLLASARSSTSSASRARRPASRSSTTSASPPRT